MTTPPIIPGTVAAQSDGTPAAAQPSAPPPTDPAKANALERVWTFDEDPINAAPAGFIFGRTGWGRPGHWVVARVSGAPSGPNVLAQLDDDATDERFPLAIENRLSMRDVHLGVHCRMVAGERNQACGLVARYRDDNNYFLTRANAVDHNIRLYTVEDGARTQLASWSGEVTANMWHAFRFELRGIHLEVFWDGEKVIDYQGPFTDAGRIGVWTKAGSVTYFDDLRAEPF